MENREGYRARVQATTQPDHKRVKGQAGRTGLGLTPNHTGAS